MLGHTDKTTVMESRNWRDVQEWMRDHGVDGADDAMEVAYYDQIASAKADRVARRMGKSLNDSALVGVLHARALGEMADRLGKVEARKRKGEMLGDYQHDERVEGNAILKRRHAVTQTSGGREVSFR